MLHTAPMVKVFGTWAACFAIYLLFAGTVSANEIITAAVIAVLGTSWTILLRRVSHRRFAFSLAHVRPWLRAIAGIPMATVRTGATLIGAILRKHEGYARAYVRPFRHGSADTPAERARRASALLAASLAPAGYVLRAAPRL